MLSTPLLSAGFASLVAICATVAVERLGGRWGGVLGTLPTTIVPASLGFWGALSATDMAWALATVPGGMLVNALFLLSWRGLPQRHPHRGLGFFVAASLSLWAVAALVWGALVDQVFSHHLTPLQLGLGGQALLIGLGLYGTRHHVPSPKGSRSTPLPLVLRRGLLAGLAIWVAVQLGASGLPFAAGMASVFPAIFLTTMVSLWADQGKHVTVGAVGPMMLGSSAVGWYAIVFPPLIERFPSAWGIAGAWLLSIALGSLPTAWWIHRDRPSA